MAEIVTSIIANIVENLAVENASPYVNYFFHFGTIVEDFKRERNKLELKQNEVKNDVTEAIGQTEEIEEEVQDWLTKSEKELREARNLEDEIERSNCFEWCPNWGWRYCLSKKVAKQTLLVSKLLESSNFPQVGRRAPLQGIEFLISNDFMPSESSRKAFDGVMKALTSDGVNIIGLYGMPGVGKTTLAKEVGKQAKEQKLFDKVIMVTVSQDQDINKIQDKIAEILGFEFKTKEVKAEELWRRLKSEKKVLIIVDDVWDRLELEHVGIPVGDGCKILLTTRLQKVCAQMNCKEKIQLNILSEDNAWTLFKYYASLENASPTLTDVAKKVAKECKGLPLAIKTIGRALKDENLDEWEAVNQRLKDSRHLENRDACEDIYMRLKISYDKLKGKNSRSCLLLCSLFPEDYEIRIEELTVYGIGQEMFDDVDSIEDARREMRVITTNLQKSGLLLETNVVGTVIMHDVVRDFVHWMTSKGENNQNMFFVQNGLRKWPRRESFGCCTTISLINCEINHFPDTLEFPKLEVFLLDVKSDSFYNVKSDTKVPSTFFQGMKTLKVLLFRKVILSAGGLQFLPNLRILHLIQCELENPSWLGNLKKLEILIIDWCQIRELWYELTGLTTLRLLYIVDVFNPPSILPKYWLSSFVQLEELCLIWHAKWAIGEESANEASLSELCLLPHLTQLKLSVPSECIPKEFVFPPLQRYDIVVHHGPCSLRHHLPETSLRLEVTNCSLDAFKELLCNVEVLELNLIMDLEYLSEVATAQNLKELRIKECGRLRVIWNGPPHSVINLPSLKFITIRNCNRLRCLFSPSLVKILVQLQQLSLQDLPELEQLITELESDVEQEQQVCNMVKEKVDEQHKPFLPLMLPSLTMFKVSRCPRLAPFVIQQEVNNQAQVKGLYLSNQQCISFDILLRQSFPNLEHGIIGNHLQFLQWLIMSNCSKLQYLFSPMLAQSLPHLSYLYIEQCKELKQIVGEDKTLSSSSQDHLQPICFPSLKEICIEECNNLKCLFPVSDALSLSQLQKFTIRGASKLEQVFECKELEQIVGEDKTSASSSQGHLQPICFPSLKLIRIEECNNLKCLFPVSVALSLSQLRQFIIRGASELEQVFEYQGGTGIEDIEKEIVLPRLTSLSLEVLPRLKCFIPMGYHCSFPLSPILNVEECPNLTTSFSTDSEGIKHARTKAAGDAPRESSATNVDVTKVSNLRLVSYK